MRGLPSLLRRGATVCLAALAALGAVVAAASATLVDGQDPGEVFAPVSVPSDHWVYPLLDRMAADGLLDGVWLPGRRPVDARAIGAMLDWAVVRAGTRDTNRDRDGSRDGVSTGASRESPPEGGPSWLRTAVEARRWLSDEYGLPGRGTFRVFPTGEIRAGDGPRTEPSALVLGSELRYRPTEDVGLWADPTVGLDSDGLNVPLPRLGVAWRTGSFPLAGSYAARRLGPGAGGGIVLHDETELGCIELALAEPVTLPWLFRYLGPFQISGYVSRIGADSVGPSVGLFAGEFVVQPHPRVTLGGYRSAMIVSEVDGERISFDDVLRILFDSGRTTPNFEDQKLSFSGSVRTDLLGLTVTPFSSGESRTPGSSNVTREPSSGHGFPPAPPASGLSASATSTRRSAIRGGSSGPGGSRGSGRTGTGTAAAGGSSSTATASCWGIPWGGTAPNTGLRRACPFWRRACCCARPSSLGVGTRASIPIPTMETPVRIATFSTTRCRTGATAGG